MSSSTIEPQGPRRRTNVESPVEEIHLPDVNEPSISQDEEWCDVVVDGQRRRIRFHDYDEIYKIPGLYEAIFYERLKCSSPSRVATLLEELVSDFDDDVQDLRILDLGAGNGMVGEELRARQAEKVVGIDLLPEGKEAALRDRPHVYHDYVVADLTDLDEKQEERLRRQRCNCLTSVAALGFGDIPPLAFLKALDLIETPGWVAFTIKEDFLREDDNTGFARLIRQLSREEILQLQAYRRFCHRMSVTGQPLYYVAMVALKQRDVPGELLAAPASHPSPATDSSPAPESSKHSGSSEHGGSSEQGDSSEARGPSAR